MELPRKILVGYDAIQELGDFIHDLGFGQKILIISGAHVKRLIGEKIDELLSSTESSWCLVDSATMEQVKRVVDVAQSQNARVLVGLGGGKSVDVAKLSAYNANLPFISVPTSASHDGISSPFASIKGLDAPYSLVAKPPIGILADITLITNAPKRLLASGCGDLIAKITAVKDWELAKEEMGEYFGKYAANLARLSANLIIEESKKIGEGGRDSVRDVVEALISAGVAACIAGSSRPCSGSEHLFSHALDILAPGVGLHGEKCGMGTIIMAKLHDLRWEEIAASLKDIHAPTTAYELGIDPNTIVDAILLAPRIRPKRYTVLHKLKLDRESTIKLATSVRVI
ncbi:MAG: NAD(P)-dependent glycerol-1-phosphate dehydrogenase [archaeon]|nr:NAD(P)-dependent glycerol-1-phosphate dehydrogenase [archaeon]MCP8306207.1 NAD(P)-dependent glycerol-1-phosphate dehydrogenase [archaeon]